MAAEAPLAFGLAAVHLGDVYDLIWTVRHFEGCPLIFVLWTFHRIARFGLHGPPELLFGLPPTQGVGVPEQNVSYNLPVVDVVLHAKYEHCRSNGVAAYREQTDTHTVTFII